MYEMTLSVGFRTKGNEDLSKAIQNRAFELGYKWAGTTRTNIMSLDEIHYLNPVIYFELNGELSYSDEGYLEEIAGEEAVSPNAIEGSLDTLFNTEEYKYVP